MTEQENDFLSMGVDPAQYEALERDFREVLNAMVGEKSMERFRQEYEKLHRALKTSYESEKRLVKRCKELQDTIVQNATRVKAAIKLTQEDSSTIGVLKKEVEKAWRLVEAAKDKEEKARKIITELKTEISHLHKIVEQGSGLAFTQDNTVMKLMAAKDDIKVELTHANEQILELTRTNEELEERTLRAETELAKEKETVEHLKTLVSNNEEERTRDERKAKQANEQKAKLEADLREARADKAKLEDEKRRQLDQIKTHQNELQVAEVKHREINENLSKEKTDHNITRSEYH